MNATEQRCQKWIHAYADNNFTKAVQIEKKIAFQQIVLEKFDIICGKKEKPQNKIKQVSQNESIEFKS